MARFELLEIFCRAWRQGRGRSVGRVDIEDSGAISDKYRQAVIEIAMELGGDAARLIETLREHRDPRLSGYRHNNTDELQTYFLDEGYLDEQPVLDEEGILEQLLGIPAAAALPSKQVPVLVNQWWTLAN